MILCAGLGTRLRPLTDERPKPLVPIDHRPLASYAIDQLAHVGVKNLVMNAHHLAEQIDPALRPFAAAHAITVTTLTEQNLLGTGGAIRNALVRVRPEGRAFIVYNGDVLARPDLASAIEHHHQTGAMVTMVLRHHPDADRLGAIEVDDNGRVVRILDEGPCALARVRRCVFTGIYIVDPAIEPWLPESGCVVRHTLRALLAQRITVSGVIDQGPWFDLGTIERYAAVQFALLSMELQWPGRAETPRGVSVAEGVVLGQGVALENAVILGENTVVRGEGSLSRVIAWEGAVVSAPCHDAIVTPRAVVPIPMGKGLLDGPK